jgi:hypothetical protein
MSLYKHFKTDENVEKTGILLEYGTTVVNGKEVPIAIRIARAGGANRAYERLMEAEVKPHRRMIQNETIEKAVVERILKKVYAQTVVLGWENVDLEARMEGDKVVLPELKNAPFNVENCIRLFEDLPDLFEDIKTQAQKASLFRKDIQDADAKN